MGSLDTDWVHLPLLSFAKALEKLVGVTIQASLFTEEEAEVPRLA